MTRESVRPANDDLGDVPFKLAQALNWTHADVESLTFPQLQYYLHGGKPPKPGAMKFNSSAEAQAWKDANGG